MSGDYILTVSNSGCEAKDTVSVVVNAPISKIWLKSFPELRHFGNIIEAPDGSVYLAGSDSTAGNSDLSIVKCDPSGNVLWARRIGGNADDAKTFHLLQWFNNRLYVVTNTFSEGQGSGDILCLKFDLNGNMLNQKIIGGSGNEYLDGDIQVNATNSGFVLTGTSVTGSFGANDFVLMNIDTNFSIVSCMHYGTGTGETWGNGRLLSNGKYVIGGVTNNGPNPWDGNVILANSFGTVQWGKYIVGSGQDFVESADNQIITCGGDGDLSILRVDQSGNVNLSKKYANNSWGFKMINTVDGGYAVLGNTTGYTFDGGSTQDVILIKLDASLNVQWSKIYGKQNSQDNANSIVQKSDGGFLLCFNSANIGTTYDEVIYVSTDAQGITTCNFQTVTLPAPVSYSPAMGNSGSGSALSLTNISGSLSSTNI
jgi:hypothetical protein